jgi:hypothetical protein
MQAPDSMVFSELAVVPVLLLGISIPRGAAPEESGVCSSSQLFRLHWELKCLHIGATL